MPEPPPSVPSPPPAPQLFTEPTPERNFPTTAVAIAAVAIAILVAVFVALGRRHAPTVAPTTMQPPAAYAANLAISNVQMSEANNTIGGKSTYIEGHIANHGAATVTAITAQVVFANDTGLAPQIESTPVFLIRSREPYIDTEPISAAPIAPGAEADFRLTFESINANWNQQQPQIQLIQISTR